MLRRAVSGAGASVVNGNTRRNTVPRPGALSTSIRPLCSWTIPWLIVSPIPLPADPLVV